MLIKFSNDISSYNYALNALNYFVINLISDLFVKCFTY